MKTKSKIWQTCLFIAGIIYIAGAPALFILVSNAKEPAIFLLISGVLLTVLSRFNDVSELGLFGLKAKIEKAISEAYATLEQVKEFAKVVATVSLSNTARSGWLGGIPEDQSRKILQETKNTLQELGCSDEEIKEATQDYHNCQLTEYKSVLLHGGGSQVPESDDKKFIEEWRELTKRRESNPVTPYEIRSFFEKYNLMTEEHQKRIDGYEYYFNKQEFLDYEDYKNRRKWPRLKFPKDE